MFDENNRKITGPIRGSEFVELFFGKLRREVWSLMENPQSSSWAKVYAITSIFFVLLSVTGLILGSMRVFQDSQTREPHFLLQVVEGFCMLYFTAEFLLRFAVCPRKAQFLKAFLNVTDLLTILPFYGELALPLFGVQSKEFSKLQGAMLVMRVLRVARVARIIKLARYSTGLRAFGDTLRQSVHELGMLSLFLLTGVVLFSTTIYFLEKDEFESPFTSIPAACWWCVITMTTVGYGDVVPVTICGKVVAACASVCGIIVLAFPISMIIDKFAESTRPLRENVAVDKRNSASYASYNKRLSRLF